MTLALAESYTIRTNGAIKIGEANLEPGRYELRLNATKTRAELYDGNHLVATSRITVSRLEEGNRYALLTNRNSEVLEFRSGAEKIVFVSEDPNRAIASTRNP
jgi:hypothetical protein